MYNKLNLVYTHMEREREGEKKRDHKDRGRDGKEKKDNKNVTRALVLVRKI